ncbi:MAG TPA: ABC transporter permease [Syntrophales bacterium]|nr:ABC transporter permease [Syntrophales bacterium]
MKGVLSSLRKVQAVARKEFYHIIRDYRSLYLAFALPIILILLFGYALSLDVDNITTVVVDHDGSAESRDLARRLDASAYFHVAAYPADTKGAAAWLDAGKASLAVIIPPDWGRNLRADREAPLQVIVDGSDPNFGWMTVGYVNAFIEGENSRRLKEYLNRLGEGERKPPLEGRIRIWFNEDLESRNLIVPGIIGVIIMIVGAMLTSLVIAREYENGTMETLKSLPLGAGEFLVGKALPYLLITMADVLTAVLLGQLLFGIVMKADFLVLLGAVTLYLCVAVSLGLFISAATRSQIIANQIAPLVTFLPSMLLSDFVFPIINMPAAIRPVTYIVPATYFINVLKGVYLKNLGLSLLWPNFLVLAAMALLLSLLTFLTLRREGM